MENTSDDLMLSGITALCPDCGDERIFVAVEVTTAAEFCCTSCDAAVFLIDGLSAAALTDRVGDTGRSRRLSRAAS